MEANNQLFDKPTAKLKLKKPNKQRKYRLELYSAVCPECERTAKLTRQMSHHGLPIEHVAHCESCGYKFVWAHEHEQIKRVRNRGRKKEIAFDENYTPSTLF